ncbi:MAG TPA: hypothetical protein VF723_02460 [Pyrinomonadaceae bacterium]
MQARSSIGTTDSAGHDKEVARLYKLRWVLCGRHAAALEALRAEGAPAAAALLDAG